MKSPELTEKRKALLKTINDIEVEQSRGTGASELAKLCGTSASAMYSTLGHLARWDLLSFGDLWERDSVRLSDRGKRALAGDLT